MKTHTKAKCPKTRITMEHGIQYLTKDKVYEITKWSDSGRMFWIIDDTGQPINGLIDGCAHVEPENWELLE